MPRELAIGGVPSVYISNVEGDVYVNGEPTASATVTTGPDGVVRCQKDIKVCPDGAYVTRRPPDCAFDHCPGGPADALNSMLLDARKFMVGGVLEQYLTGAIAGAFLYRQIHSIEQGKSHAEKLGREVSQLQPAVLVPVAPPNPSVAFLEFTLGTEPPEIYAERFRSRYAGNFPVLAQPDPTRVFLQVEPGQEGRLAEIISIASLDPAFGAEVSLSFTPPPAPSPIRSRIRRIG